MTRRDHFDFAVIGGGFYGCCLALYLRSLSERVVLIEERGELLTRASRVNQARVHAGFHYPRNFVTALRSRQLSARFARDFAPAVTADFRMLYAVARNRSKVSAARFLRMFKDMAAPIEPAGPADTGLFASEAIEGVFTCDEFAFDWTVLREQLMPRLEAAGIEMRLGESVERVTFDEERAAIDFANGGRVTAPVVFNVTYGGLNRIARASGFEPLPLKYEMAEMALMRSVPELSGRAVTVMDGPFFSVMPYPSEGLLSLSHVRYTPHLSWTEMTDGRSADEVMAGHPQVSRWRHMVNDAQRYMPCLGRLEYERSLFDIKTVLTRNERDDGRPILLHRHRTSPGFYSVMGGKIDNIYDLLDVLPEASPVFAQAHDRFLFDGRN